MSKKLKNFRTEKNSDLQRWIQYLVCKNYGVIKELDIELLSRLLCFVLKGDLNIRYNLMDGSYRCKEHSRTMPTEGLTVKDVILREVWLQARQHRIYYLEEKDLHEKYYGYPIIENEEDRNGKKTIVQALTEYFESFEKPLKDLQYYLPEDLEYREQQKEQMTKIKDILLTDFTE